MYTFEPKDDCKWYGERLRSMKVAMKHSSGMGSIQALNRMLLLTACFTVLFNERLKRNCADGLR